MVVLLVITTIKCGFVSLCDVEIQWGGEEKERKKNPMHTNEGFQCFYGGRFGPPPSPTLPSSPLSLPISVYHQPTQTGQTPPPATPTSADSWRINGYSEEEGEREGKSPSTNPKAILFLFFSTFSRVFREWDGQRESPNVARGKKKTLTLKLVKSKHMRKTVKALEVLHFKMKKV